MKKIIALIFTISFLTLTAQQKKDKTPYDNFIKRFNEKMDTAQWLCQYDNIAWWTSDSVFASPKEEQARLGSEWFCYLERDVWHALYGKFSENNFTVVYNYEVDSNNTIRRVNTAVDTALLNPYARALVLANKELGAYPDTIKVRCNQYIKRNADQSFSVWLLPAFTQTSVAVYGGEFFHLYDPSGNFLISKSEYSQGYRGFKPDAKKEIILDYTSLEEPSLGSIFFVWYYKKYFDRIIINTKKFRSTVFHDGPDKYYWVHAAKDK